MDSEVYSVSTKTTSMHGEFTPNKRLACWAESRKLSVDTAEIIAREDSRKKIRARVAHERRSYSYGNKGSHDSFATSYSSSDNRYWHRKPMGCFAFLMRCRCGNNFHTVN